MVCKEPILKKITLSPLKTYHLLSPYFKTFLWLLTNLALVSYSVGAESNQFIKAEGNSAVNKDVVSKSVDVGGYNIWMQTAGSGNLNVVFVSGNGNGNGNDSTAWLNIEPKIRTMGVRTVVYDRAGLGKSDLKSGPYQVDDEADALRWALRSFDIKGPILLVAHSYGGLISAIVTEHNPQVKGVIFVDATMAGDLSEDVIDGIFMEYRPQFPEIIKVAPKLAATIIPLMNAFPETAIRVQKITFPQDMPFVDIVAETSNWKRPQDILNRNTVHESFVAASSARTSVFARGSGHNVMKDCPDIVLEEISKMIEQLK